MSFTVPTFNLTCNEWLATNPPPAVPRQILMGNLQMSRRNQNGAVAEALLGVPCMFLLLPRGTDVRSISQTPGGESYVEVPAGSKRYYYVFYVDDCGKGFPNEYRIAMLQSFTTLPGAWATPYP